MKAETPVPPTDESLVEEARGGSDRAVALLVTRHQGVVFRTCMMILEDVDLAQDASQNALVRALRGLDGFRGEASFRGWLLRIAANEAKGLLRSRLRRREDPLVDEAPIADPAEGTDLRMERTEEAARIRERIRRLPEKQRMTVSLRIFDGLSFREIGEVLGSSEGAARVNYFHGIRRLREWTGVE